MCTETDGWMMENQFANKTEYQSRLDSLRSRVEALRILFSSEVVPSAPLSGRRSVSSDMSCPLFVRGASRGV